MSLLTKAYGLACYGFSMAMLVAFILYANNDLGLIGYQAFDIDAPDRVAGAAPLLVNIGLLLLFGVQHSVMARPGFKQKLTRVLPPNCERSTYLLATGLVLAAIVLYWQPLGGYLWSVENAPGRYGLTALYYLGWLITFAATFMINHFHLFGLQQSFRAGDPDAGTKEFKTPFFYRLVRHPIQSGVVIAMVASADMSWTRFVLAVGMLTYVAVGLYFEERDLVAEFGDTYRDYKRRVPSVLPALFKPKS